MSKRQAENLEQIAVCFDVYANDQIASKRWKSTAKDKRACEIRAEIWTDAAKELRGIEIVTPVITADDLESAFHEGILCYETTDHADELWNASGAKKVAEAKNPTLVLPAITADDLKAAYVEGMDFFKQASSQDDYWEESTTKKVAEAKGVEPVAWVYELAGARFPDGEYTNWSEHLTAYKPCVPSKSIRNLRPLYAGKVLS